MYHIDWFFMGGDRLNETTAFLDRLGKSDLYLANDLLSCRTESLSFTSH